MQYWLICVLNAWQVKDKMVYASAKGTLKDKLGQNHFCEEIHVTEKSELTYEHYKGESKPVDSRSEFEKEHEQVVRVVVGKDPLIVVLVARRE